MTLSLDVKTHAITYFGGGHDFVTAKEAEIVMQASSDGKAKGCKLKNGNWITFSSISRVTEIDQFYRENPKLRPEHTNYTAEETLKNWREESSPKAAELMRQGIKEHLLQKGVGEKDLDSQANRILKQYNN